MIKCMYTTLLENGVDLKKIFKLVIGLPRFIMSYYKFRSMLKLNEMTDIVRPSIKVHDWQDQAGGSLGMYFVHDVYVAQQILKNNPVDHLDIGSRLSGLCSHLASSIKIDVMDLRPFSQKVPNLNFIQADVLMPDLSEVINVRSSVSCTYVVGHVGLGRYGDPLDPLGHEKAIGAVRNLVVSGGLLYISVPVGREMIQFNSQRVFNIKKFYHYCIKGFVFRKAALISHNGKLKEIDYINAQKLNEIEKSDFEGCFLLIICKK